MVPRIVLTRSGLISVNAVRPVNSVQSRTAVNNAGPMEYVINNAYSTTRRHFNKITTTNNSNFTKKVNNVKGTRVNTARPKAVLSAIKGNKGNAANPQQDLKYKGVIDSGCSRHMIGNKSYLTDYKEIEGGFVAFGGNSKRGKITRKGKTRTGKLDFKGAYFVKELKFNLFSVSQMCDKKNSVLFTDTEYVVLSPDFKLSDEIHILLKVPRKDNMYSVDLKNVVPQGGLTCLFAKATPDESNLWHRRLGHVNFKTMNKLVRGSLVRGLPSKLFEINQTCVACQKGKQQPQNFFEDLNSQFKPSNHYKCCHMDLFGPNICRTTHLSFMRPFGCPVTILNTIDHLGSRPNWLFDIDALTNSKNYKPVVAGNQSNGNACTKACNDADSKNSPDARFKPSGEEEKKDAEDPGNEDSEVPINAVDPKSSIKLPNDSNMPELEHIVYSDDDEDVGAEADMNNLDAFMPVSPIPTIRIPKDHPVEQIIGED
ncbi:ribonuclease H-like domain-containing protein [Tanacetum coccineum]|uniref:Ribonuclease H-like domain-containing protein n=1 Tax=Tanacetum coccineum TaxID=301880 RepID=A0ABQ5D5R9_9ASTR